MLLAGLSSSLNQGQTSGWGRLMNEKQQISTANVVDACLRLRFPVRCAPPLIRPLVAGTPVSGPAVPVVHYGSLDVFFEALEAATAGSILVVDCRSWRHRHLGREP